MSSMEVSLIGNSLWRIDSVNRELGFCCSSSRLSPLVFSRKSKICFDQTTRWSPIQDTLRAAAVGTEALAPGKVSGRSSEPGISIGLGPNGELRYPSHHDSAKISRGQGVGEFQCYDENILRNLKQHAEALGNPLWGLSGPHDAPSYDQTPDSNTFVKQHGGSWETGYGDFFLSWYSDQLISHGDRLLSLASSLFCDNSVKVFGKVPLVHSWYKTRSHPSELTAGYYNTENHNGYEQIAEVFAKNSCGMIIPGMDLSDENHRNEAVSSPESLLKEIRAACGTHGVEVHGQNSSVSGAPKKGFEQIKRNLVGGSGVGNLFTYHRMGAYFFSPEHFRLFSEFSRSLNQPELELELVDRPCVEGSGGVVYSKCGSVVKQLQVA